MSVIKDQPIFNLKLSELCMMIVKDRKLLRVTGKIDLANQNNDGNQVVIYSNESIDSIEPNEFLTQNNIEFVNICEAFNTTLKEGLENQRFECLVDLKYLDEFNVNDVHPTHDLVQFYGYKDSSSTLKECKFRALYFRIIKRTDLIKYYNAIQIQNSYINKKINQIITSNI